MLGAEEFVDRKSIKVRRASASDAVPISSLYRQLVSNPAVSISPDHLQTLAASESHFVLVAEQDGVVKGTVLLSLCADVMFNRQPFAVVENIIVDQGARSAGIGAALMHAVEAHCKAAECSKIMMLSASRRTEAHKFFERQGYVSSAKVGFVKYRQAFA
jgi:N-acetylglutamate synthase-like GNAT family acetyltransferase